MLNHIDRNHNPIMVDVSAKDVTDRFAQAHAVVRLPAEVLTLARDGEIFGKKGPVLQTARIAGIMAAKKTSALIPFCHPLGLEDCRLEARIVDDQILLEASVRANGKTGVEMEALTAVSVAALTIYDMCKAVSHHIVIGEIKLLEKTGGKSDFKA